MKDLVEPLLRRAAEDESEKLSEVAHRSKAYWGYSPEVLASWKADLTITREQIRDLLVFVAIVDTDINADVLGVYALDASEDCWSIEHFWVLPEYIGRGVGHALLTHAIARAREGGATNLVVDADPNAEAFYVRHGAHRDGEIAAPIPGDPGRRRPQLSWAVRTATTGNTR